MSEVSAQVVNQLELWGAGGFGAIIGWYVYYINRYRKGDVQFSDITTLIGAVGGAAVLALFPAGTALFGAYGVGLFAGFFGYFLVLAILVKVSPNFNVDFFLDGRRKKPSGDDYIPGADEPGGGQHPMLRGKESPTVIVIPPEALSARTFRRSTLADREITLVANVTSICIAEWPAGQFDCNAFVKAVAAKVGVTLTGDADAILSQVQGPGWTSYGTDGVAASNAAAAGKLVIAGMTSDELGDDHGHVVVVVAPTGPLGHDKYPYAYWGSLNSAIRSDGGIGTTLNFSFNKTDRDKVRYASFNI